MNPAEELAALKVALGLDPNTARGVAEMFAMGAAQDVKRCDLLMEIITEVQRLATANKATPLATAISRYLTQKVW